MQQDTRTVERHRLRTITILQWRHRQNHPAEEFFECYSWFQDVNESSCRLIWITFEYGVWMIGIIQQQNRIGKPFLLEGWLTVSSLVGKGDWLATLIEAKQTMIVRYCENRRGKKISKHRMLSWLHVTQIDRSCRPISLRKKATATR